MGGFFRRDVGVPGAAEHGFEELAATHGTPLFVYDLDDLEVRFEQFRLTFEPLDLLVAYSVGANASLGILSTLASVGSGAAVASGGELFKAREAGIPGERIVFGGVGKSREEMEYGLAEGVLAFNVESEHELRLLAEVAAGVGVVAPFALRLNLDMLTPQPTPFAGAGAVASKFGILAEDALELFGWARHVPSLAVKGLHVHVGSQIEDARPYELALGEVLKLGARLRDDGDELDFIDLGGGFAVEDGHSPGFALEALGRKVVEGMWLTGGMRLILEPGRYVVAGCGALLTRVLHVKQVGGKTFVVTEGGMSELCRATAHGGYHMVEPVGERAHAESCRVDVVGPLGEPGDVLALDREMPLPEAGDLLAVWPAGAYAADMTPPLNSRLRPAELAIRDGTVTVIRERERREELVRGESAPE